MDEVIISETESRYFGDLFLCCDAEKSGKVPILKATEMFRSANLSNDVIRQITSVANIPQTAIHMSRVQFYACLKLIAAHQASVPLRSEVISSTVALPLPKFSWTSSPTHPIDGRTTIEQMNGTCPPPPVVARRPSLDHDHTSTSMPLGGSSGPWRKTSNASSTTRSPNLIQLAAGGRESQTDLTNSELHSSEIDSEIEHTDEASSRTKERRHRIGTNGSPEAWSTASDSPTPTNSVTERPWAKNTLWHGLFCEEQRQLLGTEEESSDRHSSDEDTEADLETVFQITAEQRDYYLKQFRNLQPGPKGLLSGQAARVFFEKSRMPVEELRHIWQLCDVTRDGALSLDEFTAAMHLVVLRRNNIPLPAVLPSCLMPGKSVVDGTMDDAGPKEADLLHLNDDEDERTINEKDYQRMISVDATTSTTHVDGSRSPILPKVSRSHSNTPPTAIPADSTGSPHSTKDHHTAATHSDWMSQSKEWTKFTESPTSNVSSPGPKPVNFDMQRTAQAVVSDPLILHPVPVRVTPIGVDVVGRSEDDVAFRKSVADMYEARAEADSPKHMSSYLGQRDSLPGSVIQRPQPKKVPSNAGAIPPPPQRESSVGNMDEGGAIGAAVSLSAAQMHSTGVVAPPLPPPRPHKHARSSSLDLNKLKLQGPTPPEVPPRVSPQIVTQVSLDVGESSSFADFAHFPESISGAEPSASRNISTTQPHPQDAHPSVTPRGGITVSLQSSLRSSAFEVYRKPATTPRGFHSPEAAPTSVVNAAVAPPSISAQSSISSDNEKRVTAINDSLRYVSFKQSERSVADVMHHLREQNQLLLRLCSDLTDELAAVHRKKEELKGKFDVTSNTHHSIV